jgi:long-chain fatty acid transport protein
MRLFARWFAPVGIVLSLAAGLPMSYGSGFGLYEGSARGNALGGTMVGRADDPSAIYFNPAGITQLSGLQVMGGATVIRPSTEVKTATSLGSTSVDTEDNIWVPPHLYGTYKINDQVWMGMGIFSRFGLGVEFPRDWAGRYNSYDAEIQTLTCNPDLALKLNEKISVAAGLSATWFDLTLKQKMPMPGTAAPNPATDIDLKLEGEAIGYGYNLAARYEVVKGLAFGAAYQSKVNEDIDGSLGVGAYSTAGSGDVTLPDEIFLGVFVRPMDKLNFEAGAVQTRWSTYDEINVRVRNPLLFGGKSEDSTTKRWKDVWRYQFGVEYNVTETIDLRAGYVYDEEAIPSETVDYLVPSNDRQLYSVGLGYHVKNWVVDLSYAYLDIRDRKVIARREEGVLTSEFEDGDAHMIGLSLSVKI